MSSWGMSTTRLISRRSIRLSTRRWLACPILRAIRHNRHLTLAQVAARCHTTGSHLSRLERGQRGLRNVEVLRELATALEIPPAWLGLVDRPRACLPIFSLGTTLQDIPLLRTEADWMRRRTLLAGAAGVVSSAFLGTGHAQGQALEHVLLLSPVHAGANLLLTEPQFARLTASLQSLYAAGHYRQVTEQLPSALAATRAADPVSGSPVDLGQRDRRQDR